MDITDMPQHIIDIEAQSRNVAYGEVNVVLTRSNGDTVKAAFREKLDLRFKSNTEAAAYIIDRIRNLPDDKSGVITLELEYQNGTVKALHGHQDTATKYYSGGKQNV